MMRRTAVWCWAVWLVLISFNVAASMNADVDAELFDVQQANKRFDQITLNLSTKPLDLESLSKSMDVLLNLQEKAKECVEQTGKKLNDVNAQIKRYFGESSKSPERVDSDYLQEQKQSLIAKQAECRLFVIRSQEALEVYQTTSLSLQKQITFTRGKPIVTRLLQFPADWKALKIPIFQAPNSIYTTFYAIVLLIGSGFLSVYLKRYMKKTHRKSIKYIGLNAGLIYLTTVFFLLALFYSNQFTQKKDALLFQRLMFDGMWLMGSIFLYRFIFLMPRVSTFLTWYGFDVVFLKRLGVVVLILYFLRKIGLVLLPLLNASDNLVQLYEDVLLLASLATMVYFSLSLYHTHSPWFQKHISGRLLYKFLVVLVFTLLGLDFMGYSVLAVNSAHIIFSFLLVSALGTVLIFGIRKLYRVLNYYPVFQSHMKHWFGYVNEPPYVEILLLRLISEAVVVVALCYLFAYLIGEASYFIDNVLDHLLQGFHMAGVEVMPVQWVLGGVAFCFLVLLSRYVATQASRRNQWSDEEEKQVALASIILYVGFVLSAILGLLLAGFSFTSLTIIAGALSVGIGLGLQSVVNNFFSGLILLIEKPIRPGDRIRIDDIEGFVKKVRLRSTQIITPAQEDIIIPNSDLITHQVTNYMFSDNYWRVKCEIGVAYGSDIDLVHEVMMKVALAHPQVVKQAPNKPMVLFRAFGDSALMFELWCLIQDVNQKYLVASELNMALDKACREHHITIAFPQRDVHIKLDDHPDNILNTRKTPSHESK